MAAESLSSWQASIIQPAETNQESSLEKMELSNVSSQSDLVEESIYNDFRLFTRNIFSLDIIHGRTTDDAHVDKGVNLSEILKRLASVIPSSTSSVFKPDTYNHITILSKSLQSYLQLLQTEQLEHVCEKVSGDTTKWLSSLFGLDNMFSSYHLKKLEGLLKVCKLALHSRYTKYATDGFTALYTRPPVVYISAAAPPEFGKKLRNELGLPQSSICTVPCNTMFGSPYTMDVAAFERLLTDDVSCGKTPLILIAYAGTPLSGHTDNLSRLREICTQSGVWFHVEGDTLANLILSHAQPSIQVATTADSLTLNLSKWFGMSTLPYCTFYRTNNPNMAVCPDLIPDLHDKLIVLPLWIAVQFMGTRDLRKIIEHASGLSQQMCHRLDMINGIKRIEQPTGVSPVVIFKYKASPSLPLSYGSNDTEIESKQKKAIVAPRGKIDVLPKLTDAFNIMLMNYLQGAVPKVVIDVVNVPREGNCIRFNPLHTSRNSETSKNDVDKFVEQLQNKIVQMDYTLINRDSFQETFQKIPDVVLIDASKEPVMGVFQCIPKYWKTKTMSNLSDMKKHEANDLNMKVLAELSNIYSCLEKQVLSNGQVCLQVGMVDETFDLQQFADIVLKFTVDMEDNVKFVESLKDSVQKSIEEAQSKLEKGRDEKFFQDGVLRSVPLVSSLYNWWSPPPKENHGVIGQSFDLSSGKLETTDKTYRYKMQVQDDQSDRLSQLSQCSQSNRSVTQQEPPLETDSKSDEESVSAESAGTLSEDNSADDEQSIKNSAETNVESDVKESDV